MAIDINEYLKDIDPDNVCGDDLAYDPKFIELEQAIKGKPEQQIGSTLIEAEPPNWRDIKKQAEALLSRTIDLRVLIWYLRSLIALEGFSGFQEGVKLIRILTEKRWDSIYPQLDTEDDNDPTERVNILSALCDSETILRPLALLPLIESKLLGKFNFREVSIAANKTTPTSNEKVIQQSSIDGAVQECEVEFLVKILDDLTNSLESLNQLENFVTAQVGVSDAPSFAELRNFLKEGRAYLTEWHQIKGIGQVSQGEVQAQEENSTGSELNPSAPAKSVSGAINNNQDVLKALAMICDYYKKHEPSSPVPIFLERATRLVGKSFMEVLENIAPNGVDQAMVFKGKQDGA
jgi:type VI secretion system protein ImpA